MDGIEWVGSAAYQSECGVWGRFMHSSATTSNRMLPFTTFRPTCRPKKATENIKPTTQYCRFSIHNGNSTRQSEQIEQMDGLGGRIDIDNDMWNWVIHTLKSRIYGCNTLSLLFFGVWFCIGLPTLSFSFLILILYLSVVFFYRRRAPSDFKLCRMINKCVHQQFEVNSRCTLCSAHQWSLKMWFWCKLSQYFIHRCTEQCGHIIRCRRYAKAPRRSLQMCPVPFGDCLGSFWCQ